MPTDSATCIGKMRMTAPSGRAKGGCQPTRQIGSFRIVLAVREGVIGI
jgi:hypothetical protein